MAQALLLQVLTAATAAGALANYATTEVFTGKPLGSPAAVGLLLAPAAADELAAALAPVVAFEALVAEAATAPSTAYL